MLEELKQQVWKANLDLYKSGLVVLTWGNVSGIDRNENLFVIKPSGVDYDIMKPEDMVVVNLNGEVIEGEKKPSSDTPTHVELYKAFPKIGGIAHSHSTFATIFSQARKEIVCYGTTHADNFFGTVPVSRFLSEKEVFENYEINTGKIIVETFADKDPNSTPGILLAGHAPFCWGKNANDAVKNSIVLEEIAKMNYLTLQINSDLKELPDYILKKHHYRKHGPNAYYGQKKNNRK
jgi:L-ribulose-5-phosphate 4-epimerase